MASQTPAIEIRGLLSDPRWPAYTERLRARAGLIQTRLNREHPLDHPTMCSLLGELRGINFALGSPAELASSDPRSEE